MSAQEVKIISERLSNLKKKHIPVEFCNRKTRAIEECKRYKATEFRLLLLYVGPIIFKKQIKAKYYNHFLILHVASVIFCSIYFSKIPDMINYADNLRYFFVDGASETYGFDFVSHNVHSLLHLAADVTQFGPLDNFSSFAFENYMQKIKSLIRKSDKPLQQIVKRIAESNLLECKKNSKPVENIVLTQEHSEGPLLPNHFHYIQYKMLELKDKNFTIKLTLADCYFQMLEGEIVKVFNILSCDSEIVVLGRSYHDKKSFFRYPCDSSLLGIFVVNINSQSDELRIWKLSDVAVKLMFLPYKEQLAIVYPLLHV